MVEEISEYKENHSILTDYIKQHYLYQLGVRTLQLGINGALGVNFQITKLIGINLGIRYEITDGLFGTYLDDYSHVHNLHTYITCNYRIK